MKRLFFVLSITALAVFSSCQKDENKDTFFSFKAVMETDGAKTSMSNGGITWNDNDSIKVFYRINPETTPLQQAKFELSSGAGTNSANFMGTMSDDRYQIFMVVYPFQEGITGSLSRNLRDNGSRSLNHIMVPTFQYPCHYGYDPYADVMTAISNSDQLNFKHANSYLKIVMPFNCTRVCIKSNNSEPLTGEYFAHLSNGSGTASGNYSNAEPQGAVDYFTTTSAVDSVVICGDFVQGECYYVGVLPGTYHGLNFSLWTTENSKIVRKDISSSGDITLTRAHFTSVPLPATNSSNYTNYELASIDANGHEYVDFGLSSGILWAKCNLGATNPQDFGKYFRRGETVGYSVNEISTAPFKKIASEATDYVQINGELGDDNDAAHAIWAGNWHMPGNEEYEELRHNCYVVYTDNYNGTGVKGNIYYLPKVSIDRGKQYSPIYTGGSSVLKHPSKVSYSITDKHIFVPNASQCYEKDVDGDGNYEVVIHAEGNEGRYWTRSYTNADKCFGQIHNLQTGTVTSSFVNSTYAARGLTIRSVMDR